jgi:hypothetical protein
MSSQSERVNRLIQEHSSLSHPESNTPGENDREQNERVTQIRQELVQIMQEPPSTK